MTSHSRGALLEQPAGTCRDASACGRSDRPSRDATTEDASTEERPLERAIPVHAAAAEPGDLAGRVESGNRLPAGSEHPSLKVRLEPAEGLSREDVQPDGDERTIARIENRRGPRDAAARTNPPSAGTAHAEPLRGSRGRDRARAARSAGVLME